MKHFIIILSIYLLIPMFVYAQKDRGISKPGRIKNPFVKNTTILKASDMVCSISYDDPSGDQTLSQGETGTLTVLVKNNSTSTITSPKLEISFHTSWNPKVKHSMKWMDSIQPGGTAKYKAVIKWDKRLSSGSVTYSAKVIDTETNVESEAADLTLNIAGEGVGTAEPVFVDVDKAIPYLRVSNRFGIAVIIGNQKYTNRDVPDVEFAKNDAQTIKQYLTNMLGYREENIIYIENATKADFERIFGTERVPQGKLYNWVKSQQSDVFIYYSGHGAPDTKSKKAYFMHSNSDPNYVQIDGYSLAIFYKNLNQIPAKSITVVLDACFSGGSQGGMLLSDASPMYIDVEMPFYEDKINLFASATGSQISSWYPKGNHTLLTYYFLRAIRGEADKNRDRNITLNEIKSFLNENVPYMARRLYGREQTPIVKGNADHVICRY